MYATSRGTFEPMIAEWRAKYFEGRASFGAENPRRIFEAAGWFALLAGGLPVVGLLLAWIRGDRTARQLAFAGIVWVAFFLLSPSKNIHYFMPAALLPTIAAIRCGIPSVILALSVVGCIVMAWPQRVPPYTADRDFGRSTLFVESSLRGAVEDSHIIYNLAKPLWRWDEGDDWTLGHHTWVIYADRMTRSSGDRATSDDGVTNPREFPTQAPAKPLGDYQFYVGRGDPPLPGLQEISRLPVANGELARLWSLRGREDWREWRELRYPLKRDLSRFNFDMEIPRRRA
jgi:hypothetical protein